MSISRTATIHASHEILKEKLDDILAEVALEEFPPGTRVRWEYKGLGRNAIPTYMHGTVREVGDGYTIIECDEVVEARQKQLKMKGTSADSGFVTVEAYKLELETTKIG